MAQKYEFKFFFFAHWRGDLFSSEIFASRSEITAALNDIADRSLKMAEILIIILQKKPESLPLPQIYCSPQYRN